MTTATLAFRNEGLSKRIIGFDWYKRLECGTYRMLAIPSVESQLEIRSEDLTLLLKGIDVTRVQRRKRLPLAG